MATFQFPPAAIRPVVEEVTSLLKDRNETLAVAETAAGGIISASILSMPGTSKIYKGGLTIYTLESRQAYAGWTQTHIDNYNGPSPSVVSGIAENVRRTLNASYCICESGTAGPTSSGRPGQVAKNRTPGYVALAVASEKGIITRELDTGLGGERESNMVAFALEALKLLKDVLSGEAKL